MAVQVTVHGGNCEKALRELKKKMQQALIFRLMKKQRAYESPSEKRVRKKEESIRRIRKNRHRIRREG